ncbi:hypothetical protein GCM10011519_12090 [Marmoricola endophyticus]|uniref:Nudix hydrolase domain-containing protein n=1 Tax=Marmoricola endophyticus TaxID=2040280 RepID=A0A917F3V2_9ACTN|nr:NUDIX hydrolase [Marmoricola endophyticus]GGF40015.1 hypothetical protein GCM10011519_12090 [Marmoricola endophyticus]
MPVPDESPALTTVGEGVARVSWPAPDGDDWWPSVEAVRAVVDEGLLDHHRVEAYVDPDDAVGHRIATTSGLRREGLLRGVAAGADRYVFARLAGDVPLDQPGGFRALLNSFLPRKRAIAQVLLRDPDDRVLLCQLTYKRDWDLPGGIVEVGESPQQAASREVKEELGLDVPPGELVLTDWMPPWGGWDDAVCLVFDGGVIEPGRLDTVVKQEREIRDVALCGPAQVRERAADFTARRVASALASIHAGSGAAYVEGGGEQGV